MPQTPLGSILLLYLNCHCLHDASFVHKPEAILKGKVTSSLQWKIQLAALASHRHIALSVETEHLHRQSQLTLHTSGLDAELWSNSKDLYLYIFFFYLFVDSVIAAINPSSYLRWLSSGWSRSSECTAGRERAVSCRRMGQGAPSPSPQVKRVNSVGAKQSEVNQSREREAIPINRRRSTEESSMVFTMKSTDFSEKSNANHWQWGINNHHFAFMLV